RIPPPEIPLFLLHSVPNGEATRIHKPSPGPVNRAWHAGDGGRAMARLVRRSIAKAEACPRRFKNGRWWARFPPSPEGGLRRTSRFARSASLSYWEYPDRLPSRTVACLLSPAP